MRRNSVLLVLTVWAAAVCADAQPWQTEYTGEAATGSHVIGLWQFNSGADLKDSSGRGHDLKLRGSSKIVPGGRFGGGLQSHQAGPGNDEPQGATAKDHNDLSPRGPFTVEMWFKLDEHFRDDTTNFLIDKKYYHYPKPDLPVANTDYGMHIRTGGNGKSTFNVWLGFGNESQSIVSDPVTLEVDRWYHTAFVYDGKGTVRVYLDGERIGRSHAPGHGLITAGSYPLTIGDRVGSTHEGFAGIIDQVRISRGVLPQFAGNVEVDAAFGRSVFRRMEENAIARISVGNDTGAPVTQLSAAIDLGGASRTVKLKMLKPGQSVAFDVPVDTSVRPDRYDMKVTLNGTSQGRQVAAEKTVPITIVARPLEHRMPVVLWGGAHDKQLLKDIGFTHDILWMIDHTKVWRDGKPTVAMSPGSVRNYGRQLDQYLADGLSASAYLFPGSYLMRLDEPNAKFGRVDSSGAVSKDHRNVCGLFPEIQQYCYNAGASVAQTFGHYPAMNACLVHSEVRDATRLCYHDHDAEAYRRDSGGKERPAAVTGHYGVAYDVLDSFPADRVVPDDDDILDYLRWFWKDGDGWNTLHSKVHDGLKSTGRDDLWTFFDPAVRAPGTWGSGGHVDVISQWTYSYPDPIKMGQATDEMFAMADGDPNQIVMKMTQVIWYRSGTAKELPQDKSTYADWEKKKPDAKFITIAPDHMREAFWSKIARPIKGIMYHGWSSLVQVPENKHAYRFTNERTPQVLTELTRDVVRPLGPTLLQVGDRKADVALLESFASQMYANRGTNGWGGSWEADMHMVLQWAHLQPRVIYDEHVVRDGLDDFKVLVMPYCDVLTESVAKRVKAFQRRGGIIVGDESLCPAITPDILIPVYKRTKKADVDKAALQALAAELRSQLDDFYQRYVEASDPDIVVRARQHGSADYIFVVNDKRTYGNYVGHHGTVMEKGLPHRGTVTVRRDGGYVYDLVNHKPIDARQSGDTITFDTELAPGGGGMYAITPEPIGKPQIDAPKSAKRGEPTTINITLAGAGVMPVQLSITDPAGREAEHSGYYGVKDGKLTVTLDLALNDQPGSWTITATELASKQQTKATLTVR